MLAACMLFCITPALAASTGVVRGVITQAGKPLAGATVTISGEGERFAGTSKADGTYLFPAVPFGHYLLTVHEAGTADKTLHLDVTSDAVAQVNVDMLQTIVVTASRANAGAGGNPVAVTTLDQQQIQTSPNRDSLNRLIETVPGVVQFSYNEPVVNGFHGVTYQIDGAPLPIATTSNFAEIVDPKDINSIEVFTGAIPAEYGGDRMGAVVNIITDRFNNTIPEGTSGTLTGGIGNQAQALGTIDTVSRFGNNELFLNFNNSSTNRGVDAPTYQALHDNSSSNDEFLRWVTKLNQQQTLSFDYSEQFSQFQIPFNTNPTDPNDPIVGISGTDDTQLEYNRYANLNFQSISKTGNSVFQLIPWYRSTRVDYFGDLANDVQGYGPNFGCANFPACDTDTPADPDTLNNVGLNSQTNANYVGVRISEQLSSNYHTLKFGIDTDRENAFGSQTYACYYVNCAVPGGGVTPPQAIPYYSATATQAQAGSQFAAYIQDQYQPSRLVSFSYGLRYDHSTGYTSGDMIEPRVGINVSDPSQRNIAHVFYGRFYAAPLLEDVRQACVIFSSQNGCADQTTGNTVTNPTYDLKPEMDSYYEFGVEHIFDNSLTGWANYFTKSVVNVLDTTQLLNTPLFAVYNNATGYNQGFEFRLQDRTPSGNNWFGTLTVSNSYAGGISGSTFLFPPGTNPPGVPISSPELLSIEDHSQTFDGTAGYTAYFTPSKQWYATLQANYGSGFPVQFEDANVNLSGTLPAHTTLDFSAGRLVLSGKGADSKGLGVTLDVNNLLNHQYVIKIANGFNTTQIANSRTFLLRLTQPF
jgi:outer membrane receptor protein involved in Fe transport